MGAISHDTKITIAFAIVLLGIAFMLGTQIQKISGLEDRMVRVEDKLDDALKVRGLSQR